MMWRQCWWRRQQRRLSSSRKDESARMSRRATRLRYFQWIDLSTRLPYLRTTSTLYPSLSSCSNHSTFDLLSLHSNGSTLACLDVSPSAAAGGLCCLPPAGGVAGPAKPAAVPAPPSPAGAGVFFKSFLRHPPLHVSCVQCSNCQPTSSHAVQPRWPACFCAASSHYFGPVKRYFSGII